MPCRGALPASTWARNIFQSDAPKAMIAAVNAVVHKNAKPKEAFEMFQSLKAKG